MSERYHGRVLSPDGRANARSTFMSARLAARATGDVKISNTVVYEYMPRLPNRTYTDLTLTYKFGEQRTYDAFLTVQNLFNTKPPIQGIYDGFGLYPPVARNMYDIIGTYYTLGMRVEF